MPALIRPELSKRNKYWVNRHRYYELKHFCLQYNAWKQLSAAMISLPGGTITLSSDTRQLNRIVEDISVERDLYLDHISMVEKAANATDEILAPYILKGVTTGVSYDCLKTSYNIPCGKDTYYDLYRKFFFILDQLRK